MPRFKFFLSSIKNPVQEGDFIWSTSIPLSRHPSTGTFKSDNDIYINHGDYFKAVRDFLKRDRCAIIVKSVSQHLHRNITHDEIKEVRTFLDKHGEFYHPAKVEIVLQAVKIPFVLNVAVTEVGKQCAQREYQLLKKLNVDYPVSFIPNVYAEGTVFAKMNQIETRMFLGEWFEGFNEFHITLDPDDNQYKIIVWDHEYGNFFLKAHQATELYRQAVKILTYYYNIETFEQIASWHHAAGDFVLRCQEDDIELKLVTVRQYRSLYENNVESDSINPDSEFILEALLVFLLNTAIKMRLDRLDGVGDIVWSADVVLKGILKGFFEGLALKPETSVFAKPLDHCFMQHLLSCSLKDFVELNHAIAHTYPLQAPEISVIQKHLGKHIKDLYDAVRQFEHV